MAFGFDRLPGTARNYINRSNPDYEIGQVISRRQFTRYTDRLVEDASEAEESGEGLASIAETDAMLADLADSLARRERQSGEAFQLRQGSGQRRYNAALEAYVSNQRARGRRINKRQAAASPEFKQIMADLKPSKRLSRDERRVARSKALDQLGGDQFFRNQYQSLYGGRAGGHGRTRVRRRGKPGKHR